MEPKIKFTEPKIKFTRDENGKPTAQTIMGGCLSTSIFLRDLAIPVLHPDDRVALARISAERLLACLDGDEEKAQRLQDEGQAIVHKMRFVDTLPASKWEE